MGLFKAKIIWFNVIFFALLHIWITYTYLTFPYITHWKTFVWATVTSWYAGFGVTAGAHRLFTHKAYKAKAPLKVLILSCYATAGQIKVMDWVRDHRVHHKFSETEADPHNSNRGFFFSHMGWLMLKKRPEVVEQGQKLDFSDVYKDPMVAFFDKNFQLIRAIWCFFLPTIIPMIFWQETLFLAFSANLARWVGNLHVTWSVNSVAHKFGMRPYDKNIKPVETIPVSILSLGEGYHNYHHCFPNDYRAAEMDGLCFNVTTYLINFFSKIGWAYDLRMPSLDMIEKLKNKLENKVN